MGYVQFLEEIGRAFDFHLEGSDLEIEIVVRAFLAFIQGNRATIILLTIILADALTILRAAAHQEKTADQHQCKQYLFHFLCVLVVLTPQR